MFHIKHLHTREIITDILGGQHKSTVSDKIEILGYPYNHIPKSTSYLGPKYWGTVPVKLNEFNSLNCFKKEIR